MQDLQPCRHFFTTLDGCRLGNRCRLAHTISKEDCYVVKQTKYAQDLGFLLPEFFRHHTFPRPCIDKVSSPQCPFTLIFANPKGDFGSLHVSCKYGYEKPSFRDFGIPELKDLVSSLNETFPRSVCDLGMLFHFAEGNFRKGFNYFHGHFAFPKSVLDDIEVSSQGNGELSCLFALKHAYCRGKLSISAAPCDPVLKLSVEHQQRGLQLIPRIDNNGDVMMNRALEMIRKWDGMCTSIFENQPIWWPASLDDFRLEKDYINDGSSNLGPWFQHFVNQEEADGPFLIGTKKERSLCKFLQHNYQIKSFRLVSDAGKATIFSSIKMGDNEEFLGYRHHGRDFMFLDQTEHHSSVASKPLKSYFDQDLKSLDDELLLGSFDESQRKFWSSPYQVVDVLVHPFLPILGFTLDRSDDDAIGKKQLAALQSVQLLMSSILRESTLVGFEVIVDLLGFQGKRPVDQIFGSIPGSMKSASSIPGYDTPEFPRSQSWDQVVLYIYFIPIALYFWPGFNDEEQRRQWLESYRCYGRNYPVLS